MRIRNYIVVFKLMAVFIVSSFSGIAQFEFTNKTKGEIIPYFSPYHEFAKEALLTRANGQSPISWEVSAHPNHQEYSEFKFLIGHSTGTSGGARNFDWSLNGTHLFTFRTKPKQKGKDDQKVHLTENLSYSFQTLEYDINQDAFGWITLTLPSEWVKGKAVFEVKGQDQQSRDWLMVFPYQQHFDAIVSPTALITRDRHLRQLNVALVNTYENQPIKVSSSHFEFQTILTQGYHLIPIPAYPSDFVGIDTISFSIKGELQFKKTITITAARPFTFHIIHHSHNDIGYSHHQTEVEKIQTQNIKSAIHWTTLNPSAIWHIESLWAVENFLRHATAEEEAKFIQLIKKGNIVLSANYANVLTGLCEAQELSWLLEYAKKLETEYDIQIQNAMITDIPGITYNGLNNYVQHGIPYLSLGPNYVETHADRGDRVGSVIDETGDQWFYWKPNKESKDKVLVGTAGKGYSFFHNIQENEKQFKWENKISQYVQELTATQTSFEDIQLRYTKNADNGPVDTALVTFVQYWNEKFISPTLTISSVNQLFSLIEKKYPHQIPVKTGEISPYWEDGAYSTAREEVAIRQLVKELIAIEKHTPKEDLKKMNLYPIHRNVVLFHEHTWGAWCSISDPFSPFTKSQWIYKKAFLDSAEKQMEQLQRQLPKWSNSTPLLSSDFGIEKIQLDSLSGGLRTIQLKNGEVLDFNETPFWEGVYQWDINPTQLIRPKCVRHHNIENQEESITLVQLQYPNPSSISSVSIEYHLHKSNGTLRIITTVEKEPVLTKESLHFRLSLPAKASQLIYGQSLLRYPQDQLPGSNREFICSDGEVRVRCPQFQMKVQSPDINLFEVGGIIDENQSKGAKVWDRKVQDWNVLYLYIFNNYWHTNYMAEQGGTLQWGVQVLFEP